MGSSSRAALAFLIGTPQYPSQRGFKGTFNAVKGWFNIGGVKVKFAQFDPNVPKTGTALNLAIELTAKSDKHINAVHVRLIKEQTKKKEDEKETKEGVLGETSQAVALDLKAGETKVLNIQLPYTYKKSLKESAVGMAGGGLMGSMASMAADLATGTKEQYLLVAEADVDGAVRAVGSAESDHGLVSKGTSQAHRRRRWVAETRGCARRHPVRLEPRRHRAGYEQ